MLVGVYGESSLLHSLIYMYIDRGRIKEENAAYLYSAEIVYRQHSNPTLRFPRCYNT